MKITRCDRCGKDIEYKQGIPVFLVTRTNTATIMDMCKECRCDLVAFMHNAKVEFDEEADKEVEDGQQENIE